MREPAVLVLGIGNVLWADEGFGVRCVERLHDQWDLGAGVRVMDGGTQGLYLVPYVTESSTRARLRRRGLRRFLRARRGLSVAGTSRHAWGSTT